MKKLFTLFLALLMSTGTMFASYAYKIGYLWYELNSSNKTAIVSQDGYFNKDNTWSGHIAIPSSVYFKGNALSEKGEYTVVAIGDYALANGKDITSVTIPHTITNIGAYAFDECTSLTSIDIPDNVVSLGSNCFNGCKALEHVSLSKKIKVIPGYAFCGCSSLKSIIIPDGVEKIAGSLAFLADSSLVEVYLPETLTEIGSRSFKNCTSLRKIIIPSNVKYIFYDTFDGCSSLDSVVWNVKNFSGSTYSSTPRSPFSSVAKQITYFEFGKGVDTIPEKLCDQMVNLTSIQIPGNIKKIKLHAFRNSGLSSLQLSPNVIVDDYSFSFNQKLLEVTIPRDCKIGEKAFYNCDSIEKLNIYFDATTPSIKTIFASSKNKSLKEITLLEGSTIMGTKKGGNNYLVFANDTVLEKITIPYSVKIHADSAFMNCKNLYSINIGGLSTDGEELHDMQRRVPAGSGLNPDEIVADIYIGEAEFQNNTRAKYITWQYIKEIKARAFKGCAGLEECIIPATVTKIDEEAFENCTGLTKVTIPLSVKKVENYAFSGCTGIEDLTIECNPSAFNTDNGSAASQFSGCNHIRKLKYMSYSGNSSVPALTTLFNSSLSAIEELEFLSGSDEIYWNSGVYTLGNDYIGEMPSLSQVTIPEGVEEISFGAFKGCTSLKHIELPNSLRKIGNRAFKNSGLEKITLPHGVKSIKDNVLTECQNLKEVEIGCVDMDTIPIRFCANCPKLKKVSYLYYGRTSCEPTFIAQGAFSNCTSLQQITIPESVKKIDGDAFANCTGVKDVIVEALTPPQCYFWPGEPFGGVERQNTLWIPREAKEDYSTADVWKTFGPINGYNWEATMQKRDQEIMAEAEQERVALLWSEEENAGSYNLDLNEEGSENELSFTIPSYTTENKSVANCPRKTQSEDVPGIRFTIEGLKPQTTYNYTLSVYDTNRNLLNIYSGSFCINALQDIENIESGIKARKLLRDNQVLILRGDRTYTTDGRVVR